MNKAQKEIKPMHRRGGTELRGSSSLSKHGQRFPNRVGRRSLFTKIVNAALPSGWPAVYSRLYCILFANRSKSFRDLRGLISGGSGLEIGGPSEIFCSGQYLPIYPLLKELDIVNFSENTVWQGFVPQGERTRRTDSIPPGKQLICEATDLTSLPSSSYDVALASHVIEHLANPIKALEEWIRVIKIGGMLVLVVPHKDGTFDHRRKSTTLNHLISDFEGGTPESDLYHLSEILENHDFSRDDGVQSFAEFVARSERNFENRCLHHHAFDTTTVFKLLEYTGLTTLTIKLFHPFHIVAIAQKIDDRNISCGSMSSADLGNVLARSPFPSDRAA